MTEQEIAKALEQYEQQTNALPDDELIGEERLQALRESEIEDRLDSYAFDLEEMPDDELLDLETIREEIMEVLLDQRKKELEQQEQ